MKKIIMLLIMSIILVSCSDVSKKLPQNEVVEYKEYLVDGKIVNYNGEFTNGVFNGYTYTYDGYLPIFNDYKNGVLEKTYFYRGPHNGQIAFQTILYKDYIEAIILYNEYKYYMRIDKKTNKVVWNYFSKYNINVYVNKNNDEFKIIFFNMLKLIREESNLAYKYRS